MGARPGSTAVDTRIYQFGLFCGSDLWSPRTITMVASKTTVTTDIENITIVTMESLKYCKDY